MKFIILIILIFAAIYFLPKTKIKIKKLKGIESLTSEELEEYQAQVFNHIEATIKEYEDKISNIKNEAVNEIKKMQLEVEKQIEETKALDKNINVKLERLENEVSKRVNQIEGFRKMCN